MKKDIEIPIAKDVHVAVVREWNEEFLSKDWNAYILNNRTDAIEMTIVVSKGYDDERKTSTMRHGLGLIAAKSFAKIEVLQEDILALDNEFFVTFFAEGKLFEKRFVFPKNTINERDLQPIPLIDLEGILPR
ncbi:hypothetical protein Q4603_06505 [Zobellia galactanivorans]|uniref:hypothetical protein n=1 Tax=Zobellia TaxID=112040 RepID=UPI000B52AEEC|nr:MULTISPECIES: hypothetical protein [Zobellia]MBU3027970.1 hypothetical protein [Zobellia galactanivorans]MDO6515964.1 hypothetical protein [Zobellia uliginosa]MDO6808249.1 hypothetical protein [Zobellia galactanivorans]OWW26618.1 hypothetical protein B4Q04_02735 [Zobellia sp. OII3]